MKNFVDLEEFLSCQRILEVLIVSYCSYSNTCGQRCQVRVCQQMPTQLTLIIGSQMEGNAAKLVTWKVAMHYG